MAYSFSRLSEERLATVHPDLARVVRAAMSKQIMDFSVNEGMRFLDRQKFLVSTGASRTMLSRHLAQSDGFSHAVDLYPHPIDMAKINKGDPRETARFGLLAGIMLSCAKDLNVDITWGGDWNRNGETLDHSFFDAVHFELTKQKGT